MHHSLAFKLVSTVPHNMFEYTLTLGHPSALPVHCGRLTARILEGQFGHVLVMLLAAGGETAPCARTTSEKQQLIRADAPNNSRNLACDPQ